MRRTALLLLLLLLLQRQLFLRLPVELLLQQPLLLLQLEQELLLLLEGEGANVGRTLRRVQHIEAAAARKHGTSGVGWRRPTTAFPAVGEVAGAVERDGLVLTQILLRLLLVAAVAANASIVAHGGHALLRSCLEPLCSYVGLCDCLPCCSKFWRSQNENPNQRLQRQEHPQKGIWCRRCRRSLELLPRTLLGGVSRVGLCRDTCILLFRFVCLLLQASSPSFFLQSSERDVASCAVVPRRRRHACGKKESQGHTVGKK